jgi:hypothetical protein
MGFCDKDSNLLQNLEQRSLSVDEIFAELKRVYWEGYRLERVINLTAGTGIERNGSQVVQSRSRITHACHPQTLLGAFDTSDSGIVIGVG